MVGWDDLRRDLQRHIYIMDEIYNDVDAEQLKYTDALGTNATSEKVDVVRNDMDLPNHQVPAEIYEIGDEETGDQDEVQEGEEEEGPESRRPRLPRERPFLFNNWCVEHMKGLATLGMIG